MRIYRLAKALTKRFFRMRKKQTDRFPAWPLIFLFLCYALNGLTQFFADKLWKLESVIPTGIYDWLSDIHVLRLFSYSVFLLTALLLVIGYVVLDHRLRACYRKESDVS